MHAFCRIAALAAVLLGTRAASAEEVVVLPQPVLVAAPTVALPPVREVRTFTVGAHMGFNGLPAAGLWLSYNLSRHFAVDGILDWRLAAMRAQAQLRWNIFSSRLTPYVGLGGSYDWGITDYKRGFIIPSVGLSLQTYGGFSLLAGLGWAVAPTDAAFNQRAVLQPLRDAPLSFNAAIGYTF